MPTRGAKSKRLMPCFAFIFTRKRHSHWCLRCTREPGATLPRAASEPPMESCVRIAHGFILTGQDLAVAAAATPGDRAPRPPLPLETSMPGVFAAGDVRAWVGEARGRRGRRGRDQHPVRAPLPGPRPLGCEMKKRFGGGRSACAPLPFHRRTTRSPGSLSEEATLFFIGVNGARWSQRDAVVRNDLLQAPVLDSPRMTTIERRHA